MYELIEKSIEYKNNVKRLSAKNKPYMSQNKNMEPVDKNLFSEHGLIGVRNHNNNYNYQSKCIVQRVDWDFIVPAIAQKWDEILNQAITDVAALSTVTAMTAAKMAYSQIILIFKDVITLIKKLCDSSASDEDRIIATLSLIKNAITTALRLAGGVGLKIAAIVIDLSVSFGNLLIKIGEISDKLAKATRENGDDLIRVTAEERARVNEIRVNPAPHGMPQ